MMEPLFLKPCQMGKVLSSTPDLIRITEIKDKSGL